MIIRGYAGFYYVLAAGRTWECRLRGKFRLRNIEFLPGDRVAFTPLDSARGVVEELLPRRNRLARPAVANVDQAVLVVAAALPEPDLTLLDRLLVAVPAEGIEPLIIINKIDLNPLRAAQLAADYTAPGYRVVLTSCKTGAGIEQLAENLKDKVSVFAGASGTGKSSLLNRIQPGIDFQTGEISAKTKRGRHTTRYASLHPLDTGGLVADTPGFSRVFLPDISPQELGDYFPEIERLKNGCRFKDCLHQKEPGCAVKEAVGATVSTLRYRHYLEFLDELAQKERRY